MRIFKSKAYRHAERALSTAKTQEQVDAVRNSARTALNVKEFGHFIKKVQSHRQKLAEIALADGR
jgi:hypothetical protein